jgi:hypothetical protein
MPKRFTLRFRRRLTAAFFFAIFAPPLFTCRRHYAIFAAISAMPAAMPLFSRFAMPPIIAGC